MSRELLTQNQQLRRQLSGLIAHARENERISHRSQALELELISAGSFKELIESVLHGYRKTADLDTVTLAMVDPEYEIQRTLRDLGIELADFPDLLFFADAGELMHLIGPLFTPALGRFSIRQHAALFPQLAKPPGSIAILPLVRQKRLIGSLNIASRAEDRFVPGMATDFIQRLAAIVAISLENVINN
jgi:two-component system, cell cycle response regulator